MAPKQAKPVFKTSTPFTETKWPQVSHDDREIITDLVCNLIAPLGDHRRAHIHPSRGKKRTRTAVKEPSPSTQEAFPTQNSPPPPPDLANHILVGLNAITRHLEHLVSLNTSGTLLPRTFPSPTGSTSNTPPKQPEQPAIIILTHPSPSSSPAHAHIPTLLHLSTPPQSSHIPTTQPRLVTLPSSTDSRFASQLGIPRVGAIAIMQDAPGAKALVEYVRTHVGVTECRWVDEATRLGWRVANVTFEIGGVGGGKM